MQNLRHLQKMKEIQKSKTKSNRIISKKDLCIAGIRFAKEYAQNGLNFPKKKKNNNSRLKKVIEVKNNWFNWKVFLFMF